MASDVTGENDKLTKLTRPTNYRLVKKGFDFTRLVEEGVRVKVDVNAALKKPRSDRYYEVVSEAFVYPEYPEKALARGIEGEVEALFDIGGDGRVNNIRLNASKKSLKHFADSIKHSLTQSRFYPAEVNGQPMPYLNVKEVFVFRIDNNQK